ncbi:hypothetical protein J9303_20830, partial [Bacillaceae bacterium Marseille-Q3522]|nr:hypothetical protein [Bacillaceae bacterium Marseille-Q3522]
MLIDLVDRYKEALHNEPSLKIEPYKLKEGVYVKLNPDKSWEENKKEVEDRYLIVEKNTQIIEKRELFEWFQIRDYYSSVLNDDLNKAIDLPARKIHSTNYLTIFAKEDVLLTNNVFSKVEKKKHIEYFYNQLEKSYTKIYDVYPITAKKTDEKKEQLEKREHFFQMYYSHLLDALQSESRKKRIEICKNFILQHLDDILSFFIKLKEKHPYKNYIKIFIEASENEYETESKIYLLPRIFTTADYNAIAGNDIVGLPSGDITMNSKKPFYMLRTMETKAPIRVSLEEAMLRKDLYKWLESKGKFKTHVYKYNNMFRKGNDTDSRSAYHFSINANGSIDFYENVPFIESNEFEFYIENITGALEKVNNDYVKKYYQPIVN